MSAPQDLCETAVQSMKKRLPWLMILLISAVVGIFEGVVAALPIVIWSQL